MPLPGRSGLPLSPAPGSTARQLEPRLGCAGVACNVGETLLPDPVDDELRVRAERVRDLPDAPVSGDPGLLAEALGERYQGAVQPKVVECLRTQTPDDLPEADA